MTADEGKSVAGGAQNGAESGIDAEAEQADESGASTGNTSEDGTSVEMILLLVGLGLAIVGAALLLLTWLARRSADPLLR